MDATATALPTGTELVAPADQSVVAAAATPVTPLQRLQALPPRQKWTAAAGLLGLLALMVAMAVFTGDSRYKPLFDGSVSDRDSGEVLDLLKKLEIPYKVSDGHSILVPADRQAELRMRMATAGYPKERARGNDLLDNARFGQSQQQERAMLQRAKEGELIKALTSLKGVEAATVNLALPAANGFFREKVTPKASVALTLRPGHALDRAQIAGVVHLVSNAVPDLSPKDVSVVDQEGNLLTQSADDNGQHDLTQQQRKHKLETEAALLKRVNDILEPALGKENLRATVTADIDFNQVESTSEAFRPNKDPAAAAVRSQHSVETSGPGQVQPTGVPGAASNQPPTGASAPMTGASQPLQAAQAGSTGGQSRRENQTNYEVDRKVELMRNAVGMVRRVNVAVVVNHRPNTDPKAKTTSQPVPQEELDKLTALVQEAVGFNKDRGDSVKVLTMPFRADLYPKPEELPLWKQPWLLDLIKTAGVPLVLLLVALTLVFAVIRPALKKEEPPEEATDAAQLDAVVGGPEALPGPEGALIAPDEEVSPHMAEQLEDARLLARQNPLAVANILRTWVHGEATA